MALAEDLSAFLPDFGVSVAFDGADGGLLGIYDAAGTLVLGDGGLSQVSATDRTVFLRTDQLGTLAEDSTIVVDGVSSVVRDIQPIEDGKFSMVWLR